MAKDITRPDTLTGVHDDDEGTGIYWFRDSSGQFEQIFVPSITRSRSHELANDFGTAGKQTLDSCRWVPDQVETVQSLVSRRGGGTCRKDLDCVDNACKCINERCRRK